MTKKIIPILASIVVLGSVLWLSRAQLERMPLLGQILSDANNLFSKIDKENSIDDYAPSDLVELSDLDAPGQYIRSIVYDDLARLINDSNGAGAPLEIVSAYRSYAKQNALYNGYLKNNKNANSFSAEAGHSEHQLGTTIDFDNKNSQATGLTQGFADTKGGQWLASHSWEYGFILSYPQNKEQDTGYIFEPWHYRFIDVYASIQAHHLHLTLQEYMHSLDAGEIPSPTWMGPPVSSPSIADNQPIELIKFENNPELYILATNNIVVRVPNKNVFDNLELNLSKIKIIPAESAKSYTESKLIKSQDSDSVYYITSNGFRHLVPDTAVFESYDNKWSDVVTMNLARVNAFPETTLVKTDYSPNVYSIENGKKRLIISVNVFNRNGFAWNQILVINQLEMDSYPTESPIR